MPQVFLCIYRYMIKSRSLGGTVHTHRHVRYMYVETISKYTCIEHVHVQRKS